MRAATLADQRPAELFTSVWAYARHELLYLAWAILEVALLAPLALTMMSWAGLWPAAVFALWMLLVVLIPFNLNRLLTLYGVPAVRQRRLILAALLVTIIVSLRTLLYEASSLLDLRWVSQLYRHFAEPGNPLWGRDLTLLFLLLFLWWRGLSLTGRSPDIDDIGLRLRVSSLIFAPLVVGVSTLAGTPVFGFVLLYFFVSLVAVSLTRAEEIALERTGRSYPLRARWLVIIASTSLVLVVVAGLLALAISGRGLEQLVNWTAPIWVALRFFATALVSIVSYLVFNLLRPFFWLAGRLFAWLRSLNLVFPLPGREDVPVEEVDLQALLRALTGPEEPIAVWVNRLLLLLFIALLLFLSYLAVSRFISSREMALASEERAGTPEEERRGSGFGQRLRRRLSFWQQWRAAASVRRIYRQMSALAEDYGYARAAAQTPYEYLLTLAELWPEGRGESDLITHAYVRVRYGELPESEEELQALRSAWEHLRRLPPPREKEQLAR